MIHQKKKKKCILQNLNISLNFHQSYKTVSTTSLSCSKHSSIKQQLCSIIIWCMCNTNRWYAHPSNFRLRTKRIYIYHEIYSTRANCIKAYILQIWTITRVTDKEKPKGWQPHSFSVTIGDERESFKKNFERRQSWGWWHLFVASFGWYSSKQRV